MYTFYSIKISVIYANCIGITSEAMSIFFASFVQWTKILKFNCYTYTRIAAV